MGHRTSDAISEVLTMSQSRVNFICAVNDENVYQEVLLKSLAFNRVGTITRVVGASSAADAFNRNVVNHPPNEITVLVHQDVYIPEGWTDRLEGIFDNVRFGVAGCVGCSGQLIYGDVYASPTAYLDFNIDSLPVDVDSLDELVLIFPSNTPIRLDEELGWHMYGADACQKARMLGQRALVIKNRVVHYNKRTAFDENFWDSIRIFYSKYKSPIKTTIATIWEDGSITSP